MKSITISREATNAGNVRLKIEGSLIGWPHASAQAVVSVCAAWRNNGLSYELGLHEDVLEVADLGADLGGHETVEVSPRPWGGCALDRDGLWQAALEAVLAAHG